MYYIRNGELYHHGVKGMRWGVRRYQNPDGSLTALGRQHYGREIVDAYGKLDAAKKNLRQEKRNYNRRTLGGMIDNYDARNKLDYAKTKTKWAKEDLSSAKTKARLSESKKEKSKHRLDLEKKYREKGMTAEEAEIAAYKRERTEKILAVTLGVTVAAAAAYVAYKHYDYSVDKTIKSGTMLSRVSKTDTVSVHDAFYAATGKHDTNKYVGLYATQLKRDGGNAYQKTLKATKDIRVASEKTGLSVLQSMGKDAAYKQELADHLRKTQAPLWTQFGTGAHINVYQKGINSLEAGKIDKNVYNAFNLSLTEHDSDVVKGFYSQLAAKGYGAVVDVNDKRISGYAANMPLAVFSKGDVAVEGIRKLGEREIAKAYKSGMMDSDVRALPSYAPRAAVASGIIVGRKVRKSRMNDKIVRQYRVEHPDTKLSYSEIVRNAEKKRLEK